MLRLLIQNPTSLAKELLRKSQGKMHFHIVTSTFYLLQQKMLKFEGCKIDPKFENKSFLMQNFYMELDMKKSSDPKTLVFVSWALKTSLGQFGPQSLQQRTYQAKLRTEAPIFTNRTSIFQESREESNKIMKSENVEDLGMI